MQNFSRMEKTRPKETCLVIMTGLLVFWWFYRIDLLIGLAIAVGIIGAFIPYLAKWLDWAWYKLSEMMGFVMSRVLLTLIFFLFLFPIALAARLSKKDSLQLRKKPGSYWTNREHQYTRKDLENPW